MIDDVKAAPMPISPEEFAERMELCKQNTAWCNGDLDEEDCHVAMDRLMTEVLESLGYSKGIEIFWDTPKWYA